MPSRHDDNWTHRAPDKPPHWLWFVELDPFPPAWKRLRLGDDDLRSLQISIVLLPELAPVIRGTGGVRKLRFAPRSWNTGKSGAVRVSYAYFPSHGLVALIFAHDKSQAESIPAGQRATLRALIADIQRFLDRRGQEFRA